MSQKFDFSPISEKKIFEKKTKICFKFIKGYLYQNWGVYQNQKPIFCRKIVFLKLERYMFLDTKRRTKNALIQATVGIFTFSKNLGDLWDLLYQNKQ